MAPSGPAGDPPAFTRGVILVACAGILYGTLVIFAKFAYDTGIAPLPLLVLRYGIAALLMWGALAALRPDLLRLPPRGRLIGLGLGLLYAAQSFAYFWGFRATDATATVNASTTGLLFNTFPLWIAVLASLFLREKMTAKVAAALGLGVAGTALTAGALDGSGFGALRIDREGLILGAAFGYAVYVVAARKSTGALASEPVAAHVLLGSALGFLAAGAALGALPLSPSLPSLGYAVALAVVATLLPILLFLKGLSLIGASRAGVIGTLEPVVTVLLAAALLGDRLGPFQAVGGALVVAASLLVHWSGLKEAEAALQLPRE
jgi:drug/metabolite transporter (DMT)-like permease